MGNIKIKGSGDKRSINSKNGQGRVALFLHLFIYLGSDSSASEVRRNRVGIHTEFTSCLLILMEAFLKLFFPSLRPEMLPPAADTAAPCGRGEDPPAASLVRKPC